MPTARAARTPARNATPDVPGGGGRLHGGVPVDIALLTVAIAGVSLSAPLAAATAAPALAIAFWRNAMAVGALTPLALWRHRGELRGMGRRTALLSVGAG
ncbi:EamA family transporter, partial [Streptomyces sp. SID8382]|nr:EamA family transporter [Streptomyces sp. SID8382]